MHHIERHTSVPELHAGINKKNKSSEPGGSRGSNQHERHEDGERSADTRAGGAERGSVQSEALRQRKNKNRRKSRERGERSRFLLFSTLQIDQSRLERRQKQQRADAEGEEAAQHCSKHPTESETEGACVHVCVHGACVHGACVHGACVHVCVGG